MRCDPHAQGQFRALMKELLDLLYRTAPCLFEDKYRRFIDNPYSQAVVRFDGPVFPTDKIGAEQTAIEKLHHHLNDLYETEAAWPVKTVPAYQAQEDDVDWGLFEEEE